MPDAPGLVAEFKVVRDVLEKSGTPEQVNNLTEGVRAELNAEDRGRFDQLLAGTDGGDAKTPPLTGPGGEGQKGERPDPGQLTDMGNFAEELKQRGFSEAEIKQRITTFEKLNAGDASPEDKRAAKLFRVGMDLEQAREFSKLGDEEVDEIVAMSRESSLSGGSLRQFFTGIQKRLERISPTKPLIIKTPTLDGIKG